jgi:hypothetical protein
MDNQANFYHNHNVFNYDSNAQSSYPGNNSQNSNYTRNAGVLNAQRGARSPQVTRHDEEEYDGSNNMNNYHHSNNNTTRNHLQTLNNHANNYSNEGHNIYQNKTTPNSNNSAINSTSNINSNHLTRSALPPQLSLMNPDRNNFNNTDVTRNPDLRVNYNELAAASQVSPSTNYNEKVRSPYSEKAISPVENTKSQILSDFGEFDNVTEYAIEGRPNQYNNQNQESHNNEQDVMEFSKRSMINMIQSEHIDNLHLTGNICIYVYIYIYIYIHVYIYI